MVPAIVDLDLNGQTVGFRHVEYAKEIILRFVQPTVHFLLRRPLVLAGVKGRGVYEHDIFLYRGLQSSFRIFSEFASDCLHFRRAGWKICANFDEITFCHFFYELRKDKGSIIVRRGWSYQTLPGSRRAHHTR